MILNKYIPCGHEYICNIPSIYRFPALLLVSVWYSGPLWIWGDVSCHDILVCVRGGCWRRPLEHASLQRPVCTRICVFGCNSIGWSMHIYDKPKWSKCIITQRGICRITMIMYNMRQKDLSSVYMWKPGRICVVIKCKSYRTQCIHIIS